MKIKANLLCFFMIPVVSLFASACQSRPGAEVGKLVAKKGKPKDPENKQDAYDFSSRPPLDTVRYNKVLKALANGDSTGRWPAKAPYPVAGAVLPFNRIVAFYGNLYSKKMGILGEIPKDAMLAKLKKEVAKWQAADSMLPVIPALHYVAITAQGYSGRDKMYRLRMPFHQIDTILGWAKQINGLVFLDIQVGHSTVSREVPTLEKYLSLPNVHLGIDPEFSMKGGEVPGSKIGTYTASDINAAIEFLAHLVRKNNLPPKILVVHRFTQAMVKGIKDIKKVPEVQIVMDMDGWGDKTLKKSSYILYEFKDPVQFTGFKLFYKNDIRKDSNGMYTPQEILKFKPKPSYIQYQ
ncbi:MAG: lipoprotein [Flavisolibacter sp.]